MQPEHFVGVITRTKDRPLLLSRSIESVLNQTHENFLHIIVNDGGDSEALHRVLSPFSSRYRDRLKLIENANSLGTTGALNVGMRAADSEYVVTHDDDDTWEPRFLEKTIEALRKRKELVPKTRGIISHATLVNETVASAQIVEKYRYSFNGWIKTVALTRLAAGNFIPPISFLFERAVLSEIGFFNEEFSFAEDWEFYLRFLSRFEIGVVPEHLANYHLRESSTGTYGNTVTTGIDSHGIVGAAIRNEMIRRDFVSGKFGLGHLIALANSGPLPGNLKHKLWGIQRRKLAQLQVMLGLQRGKTKKPQQ